MLVTFQEQQVWQHLVPHFIPAWSHEETTVAKHTFNRYRCSRCTEDFLKHAVQDGELCFLLHSFPGICQEASALLTYEAQVVLHCDFADYSGGHGHTNTWLFKVFDSRPKRGLLDYFARPRPRTWHSRPRPRTPLAGLEVKATASRTPSLMISSIGLFYFSDGLWLMFYQMSNFYVLYKTCFLLLLQLSYYNVVC